MIRLKKYNKKIYSGLCVLLSLICLLLCVPSLTVKADDAASADVIDDAFGNRYVHFYPYINKSSYQIYNKDYFFETPQNGASLQTCNKCNVDSGIVLDTYFDDNTKKLLYDNFDGFNGDYANYFDIYVFNYRDTYYKTYIRQLTVFVPKDHRLCFGLENPINNFADSQFNGYVYFYSDVNFFVYVQQGNSCDYYKSFSLPEYDNNNKYYSISLETVHLGYLDLAYANIAYVNRSDAAKFISGDDSVASNKVSDKKEYPAESFYWDDMTCQVSSVGSDKYAFSFNYDYSCPLMVNPDELFSCDVIYNSDIRYQDGKGRIHTYTDSKQDMFSLNKHRKGYVNNSLCLNGQLKDSTGSIAYNSFLELMDGIVGIFGHVDTDLESNTDVTVKSAKLYVTVFLYHIPDPDRFFTDGNLGLPSIGGDEVPSDARVVQSTDVRYFTFDLFTLKPDQEVGSKKPIVTTKDVTDDNGNVTDKKVTDVVATDDSGKTVINITIDNSNKVIDGNANVNTGGGSGSGDGDDEDKNSKSFWKYVSGIVALFTALLNSDSGLFAVIASYFKFIPKDFWSVTIGAIVVIAVLSIYRLAKKGG